MDAKRLITLFALFLLTASAACAPAAATPARIAQEARPAGQSAPQSAPVEKPQAPAYAAPAMPAAPAEDNQFQDYGVNPETRARYDHLSTFALDVDTASYSITRKYLDEGNLPPYEAVRVEEFVNSFDQGYAAPRDAAFTIYADGSPAPRGFEEGGYVLRFGIQGYRVEDYERKPSVLTFVIDVSGSMNMENRLGLVKRSLEMLVEQLRPSDTVSIVVYGTEAHVITSPYDLNAIKRQGLPEG